MICTSCIAMVAAGITLASKRVESYEMVIVARVLYGYSTGLGASSHVIYLAEISPRKIRGSVTLTSAVFLSLGKLCGQFCGLSEVLGREELWDVVLCVPAVFSAVQVVALPFLPEAPRYLFIEKGHEKACKKGRRVEMCLFYKALFLSTKITIMIINTLSTSQMSKIRPVTSLFVAPYDLKSLWGRGDYRQEMEEMQAEQAAIEQHPQRGGLQLLADRGVRWQLLTMSVVYCCNQLSGIPAVRMLLRLLKKKKKKKKSSVCNLSEASVVPQINIFSYDIFLKAGIPTENIRYVTLGLGVSQILTSVLCPRVHLSPLINQYIGGRAQRSKVVTRRLALTQGLLIERTGRRPLFWGGYGLMAASLVLVSVTLNLKDALDAYCFVLFTAVCLLASAYTFALLPETRGKTMVEIAQEFSAIARLVRPDRSSGIVERVSRSLSVCSSCSQPMGAVMEASWLYDVLLLAS
ncbi:Solute carrier family 2, facilitated glucose transporter member 9 [Liparis tanakae]|uniref:Solute carrier family 2, facilitated glucose transporter member 9 n=1 Tax=Liparis tanakae TaxID=230148 RepID=A0A4Z2ISI9_9TELE|nr:Solute carrier family 2, facilitated glucose transporter member 9 [Liparis tanakae]